MRTTLLPGILLLMALQSLAKQFAPVTVPGLPTGEVYDLFADSRGFLWAAHAMGISRYDGTSFTHFFSDKQTSKSMTDITEDEQGRIWCHNFNGQIFYISDEKMNWLDGYDYSQERNFPRTMVWGGELLATSDRGLFICNTATLQGRYIAAPLKGRTKSIAIAANLALAAGDNWYIYSPGAGLRQIGAAGGLLAANFTLQPLVTSDTFYAIENNNGTVYAAKLLVRQNKVVLASHQKAAAFLNTISKVGETVWVNAKTGSATTEGSRRVTGLNLSDVVEDKQGNYWYASLQKGVLFEPKLALWRQVSFPGLQKGDYITSTCFTGKYFLYGTNSGQIFCTNISTGKKLWQARAPAAAGAVEKMYWYGGNAVLVTPSIGLCLLNLNNGSLYALSMEGTVKEIAAGDSTCFVAYPGSLASFPLTPALKPLFAGSRVANMGQAAAAIIPLLRAERYLRGKRCRDVCFDSSSHTVYASFKDGLFSLQQDSFRQLQYSQKPVYAASVYYAGNKEIAISFSDGIFFIQNGQFRHFSVENGLATTYANYTTVNGNCLFVAEGNVLQMVDIASEKVISTMPLPAGYNGTLYSVTLAAGNVYLAASSGLYTIPVASMLYHQALPVNYLLGATANNGKTISNHAVLAPAENNLLFTFASPGYIFPKNTFFCYRLLGSGLTDWQKMPPGEQTLSFASLQAGVYTLEAYAVNYRMQQSAGRVIFSFTIKSPWWQRPWFVSTLIAVAGLLLYFTVRRYVRSIQVKTRLAVERDAIENELRKNMLTAVKSQINPHFIFNCLNSIKLYTEQNNTEAASLYLTKFAKLIRSMLDSARADNIVLSEEISLLNLYLELESMRFKEKLTYCIVVQKNIDADFVQMPPLLIQPYVENAVWHGLMHKEEGGSIQITFSLADSQDVMVINITDNGVGRAKAAELKGREPVNNKSYGTKLTQERIDLINELHKSNAKINITDLTAGSGEPCGTLVTITIPLK